MKRFPYGLILVFLLFPVFSRAADEARFMTHPDISGDHIVFTYDDDLWLTNTQGAAPVRITTHPGREYGAKFSPDEKWIAFTGAYQGTLDVYLVPAEGGTPRYRPTARGWPSSPTVPGSINSIFRMSREEETPPL